MVNSESTPSEKELLPEELKGVVETHAELIIDNELQPFLTDLLDSDDRISMINKTAQVLTNFWFNMQRAFEALPDPAHEIPASNGPTETTPREDLIDVAVLNILEMVDDLWPDHEAIKKDMRDELMDLLERVVERMT